MEQLTLADYVVLITVLACILLLLVERLVSRYGECEHKDEVLKFLHEMRGMLMKLECRDSVSSTSGEELKINVL